MPYLAVGQLDLTWSRRMNAVNDEVGLFPHSFDLLAH
jgi:hypothetical protein